MCILSRRIVSIVSVALALTATCGPGSSAAAQEGGKPAAADSKNYEVRIVRVGETSFKGIRFKRATGETWKLEAGKWEKLPDAEKIPAGDYDVMLFATDKDFYGFRLERASGTTWFLKGGVWTKIQELPPPKTGAAEPGRHDLRHVRIGATAHVVRFNTKTGAAAMIDGSGAFKRLPETTPVPAGDYEVTMLATEIPGQWMAFRTERSSGTTWLLTGRRWFKVTEPGEK